MSSVYANIQVNLNTASAVANLKALQKQANAFASNINAANAAQVKGAATVLQEAAVASGAFTARMLPATGAVQSFNEHLLKNKFSLGDYARYSAAATKETGYFNRALKSTGALTAQTNMINQVATQRVQTLATQYVALGKSVTGANQVMALTPTILNKNTAAQQMALEKQRLMNMLIADGSTKMLNWGKNMQWAGRQLMVGFTLPLTLFAGIAISVFNDMEKQALEFKKVYGDLFTTEPEMQQNLKAVKQLGLEFTKYGIAVKDTMKMATTAAASGQKNEDLIAATTEATRLQVLGQMEAQDAMATTISLQTAFKMSNTELTESINFLNAVENQTVLTLQDVTEAIPRVATVINSFGGGVEELSVLLVAMKEGGVSAAEGANALKNSLARLITPTAAARKMTAEFGIDLESIVKNNRGQLIPMLTELSDKLNKLGGTQRQEVLSTLFGKYQYARIGVMLQSLTDKSSQASRAMNLVTMSTKDLADTAERELGRVESSTSSKSKAVMEKLKAGLIPIGEEFLKAAMPILEFLGKIIEKFNSFGDTVKQTIVTITTVVGIIAPTFLMMLGLFGNLIAQGIKTIQFFRRMAGTIAGNGKAWQRLTLEELEAQTMSNALSKQTVNTTGALMSQVQAIGMLNRELAVYIVELQKAAIASAALAGTGTPAMLGRIKKVKPPRMLNDGGKVFDSSSDTYVPGTGNKDTVPAILTPGEFVVNKQATKENISILHAINNGEAIQRNKGGIIPGMQYFIKGKQVKKAPKVEVPKPPTSIPINPTPMWRGSNPNDKLPFGGLNEKVNLRKNLLTESSRLHSLLQSLWSNRSRAGARTTLRPEGLLRQPLGKAPRISLTDAEGAPAWVYGQKDIDYNPTMGNRIYVSRPNLVQRDIELGPNGLATRSPGEILHNSTDVSGMLQHEIFHLSKPKGKYNSSREQGREEAKAMVAQSTIQGRLGPEGSYQQISSRMKRRNFVNPSLAPHISQEFGEEYLKHITRTQIHRGQDIGNIRDFYQTTRRQRAREIPTGPGSRTQIYSQEGYATVRRDAALAKIFDSFIPISKTSNPKLYREITRAAKRRGIPKELFVEQVGNREMIQTSALLMNARAQGVKPFNDIFMKLLDSGLKRKTHRLEDFFGGRRSQTRRDPLDSKVLNQLVDDVTNPSFQSIRDNNLYNQRFNQGGIIPGYAGGGRVRTQIKKGLAKYNQERTVSGESILASARAGLNETQSRYGVIHRNYDVNPAIEFLRNMGVLKPGALKQDIWNRVRNVRQFGLNHPDLVSAPSEIFIKRDLRTETRRRVPQTTDPDYQPSYDKTLRRLISRDDSTISMYSPIRINTASTKGGQARSGFDTEISDAGYSRSASSLTWAKKKLKKEEMPGIYIDPKAREGDLFKKGLLEHEYSHQSRGIKAQRLSSPIEEARAMTTEISVTGKQIDRHYLESQQKRLEGKSVIQNADERQKQIERIFEDINMGRYSPKWIESHIDEIKRLQDNIAPFSALLPPSTFGKTPHLARGIESRADQLRFMLTQLEKLPRINPSRNPQSKKLIEDIFGLDNMRTYSATEVFAAGMINPIFTKSSPELSQSFLLSLMKEASSTPMSGSMLDLAAKKAMTKNFNTGDIVPGMGSKDTVPAMLTPGEFVVNKQSTQSNLGLLHQINNGNTPPELQGFNKGGPIPGVQYFGGGGQSSKGNLEFLHLFGHDMATKEQTERLKATSKNQLVSQSPNEQFRLYSNLGIIGPKDMQYGQKNATGEKMSKLFTPQLMDQTMKPFYKAFAEASGRSIDSVMNDSAVRTSVTKFGERLGGALATHATTMTPAIMEKIVGNSIGGDPIVSQAVAHASQMTTLGYNRPSQMRMPDGSIMPVDRAGEHERAAVTKPQQREVFNQNKPFPSYTGWWSKKGGKFLNDTNVPPSGASRSGQPTGQAAAGPQPKVKPAPLGQMPPPLNIVPTTPRKDIAKQTRLTAQSNVLSRLDAESRSMMSQVRPVSIGPLLQADQRAFEQLRREVLRNLIAQKGSSLLAEEQQKVGKQAMRLQRQQNKRDAKKLAQTKIIGDNNARLIAQQRDTLMTANPALTKQQATSQARRLVLPQPERAPREPRPMQKEPTTLNQRARALARQQLFQENLPKRAKGEQRIARTRENFPAIQRAQPSRVGPILSATALPAAEKQYSQMLATNMATILPRLEARAKLGLDENQRAARGQDVNRKMFKKLGLVDPSTLPKKERQAQRQANRAYLNTEAGRQAYNQAMPAILAPSLGERIQGARQAAASKVKAPFNKYNNAWQTRTNGPTFFKSGAVPMLDEKGRPVRGVGGKPMTQKAQSKMQKGAGKAAGGIGSIGMMASMMPMFMQDDKGKFMGMDPMAAMGGIMGASMLANGIKAMIGSATAAISTIGMALGGLAVVAIAAAVSIKMWRDSVNSSAKAAAELGANLGGAANAANKMGKVLGIDTPAQRQAKMQMGFTGKEQQLANDRFGQALSSDQGKAFVEELKKGTTSERINKVQDYMKTAIATKQLTPEDAKLFTKTLATALGDPIMGTAVVRSISSAMSSPNAMKGLADKRLKAVEGNAAIAEVMRAPSLFAESTNDTGYQKSIATDVSAFAIGSAVQVIQDYSNVIAMTREQYQQGLIDFEKYNNVIRESTAIQNKYSEILSKAVGGAVDVQGARQALDSQLVAGGMSQEQVDALTHATDIGVSGSGALTSFFTLFGQGGVSAYQSDFIARGANKMGMSDSQLTPDQLSKLKGEAQASEEAAKKMFEGGLNENLKAAVLAGKMTAEAAAALGTQLMNNSRGAGATQYQKMAEQGQGVLGLEQAGFIDTTNAMGVAGLKNTGTFIDVGLKFSESGGSLAEYQTFFNSIPTDRKQVYVDVLARTTYEGQTSVLSGAASIIGAYGEELGGKILGSQGAIAAARTTKAKGVTLPSRNNQTDVTLPSGKKDPLGLETQTAYSLPNNKKDPLGLLQKPDTSINDAYTKTVTDLVGKLGSEQTAYNVTLAAKTSLNGKPSSPADLTSATRELGTSLDFIQKTLPEDILRQIELATTDPVDIQHWNDVSKSFVEGWLTISQLNPNINLSAVVEFLTVDENGPIDEKTRAERVNSLNNAYSDLEKSKDINIRKEAYVTLGTAQIRDLEGNLVTPEAMNETLNSLVSEFGGGVLKLDPITLLRVVDQIIDASSLRKQADAIMAGAGKENMGAATVAAQLYAEADAMEKGARASVGPAINNLNNSKSGGGGAKKENPIKDMNKGFLEQIKMYTNMDANLKRLNDARGKFAESLTKGKGIIQKLREAGISEGIISQLASKGFDALKKGYDKFVTKGKANALGRNENELARVAAVGSARNDVATAVASAKNQTRGAKVLRGMEGTAKEVKGMTLNAEELSQALNDPAFADAFSRISTKKGRAEVQAYVNDVLKARPVLEKAMREMADPRQNMLDDINTQSEYLNAQIAETTARLTQESEKKFSSDYKMTKAQADLQIAKNQQQIDLIQLEIDKKQESNDLDQHSIDLLEHSKKQWQDKIDLVQVSIDAYQKSIDAYQHENELRNQEANVINHSLDIMSEQETQITDAYNKRIDALDEVAKINDYIINQQRGQLNLAQALSQGDVYAATAAAQDMQANSAQFAQDQMRTGLQTGMENQIAGLTTDTGLTRVQAEAELNRIKEMNYQNDLLVTGLQNQIYTKTQEMLPYKTEIEKIDKNIATYTETIWQRNNDIYNIETNRIKPLEDANKELDRKLKTSSDQLAIDVKESTMQYQTQLDMLDLAAKNVELSFAQEAAASLIGKQWENILGLILEANKALANKNKLSTDLAARPAKNAKEAKANIDAAKAISDEANRTYEDTIRRIGDTIAVVTAPAAAAPAAPAITSNSGVGMLMATGGIVGDGARDSIPAMVSPGEFVMRKASVQKYGMPMLSSMNMGAFETPRYNVKDVKYSPIIASNSTSNNINAPVYNNYSVNVSSTTSATPDDIANTVMTKIRNIENMSVRSYRGK